MSGDQLELFEDADLAGLAAREVGIALVPTPEAPLVAAGTKFDANKPDWSLLDRDVMNEVLKVLADGARVHGRDNWKSVDDGTRRYACAAIRHAMAILAGEDLDSDHGTLHGAHVAVNGMFLTFFAQRARRMRAYRDRVRTGIRAT